MTIEYSFYLQPMGLSLFPGSAIEAALPSGMGSKWVRFNGNVLNIKNKMASLSSMFSVGTGYNAGGIGLRRETKKRREAKERTTSRSGPTRSSRAWHSNETGATGSHRSVAEGSARKSIGYVVAYAETGQKRSGRS